MNRKTMLMALAVACAALFAMPAVASAFPAHIDKAEKFTISGNETFVLEKSNGEKIECHGGVAPAPPSLTGEGEFENTTTGWVKLTFHNCTTLGGVACTTAGQTSGTIVTEKLPFHLISTPTPADATHAGVLITPVNGLFAVFNCGLIKKEVKGNGVIGEITSPTCQGAAQNTATLKFTQAATTGNQNPQLYTEVNYNLTADGLNAAQIGSGTITFGAARTITCTHA